MSYFDDVKDFHAAVLGIEQWAKTLKVRQYDMMDHLIMRQRVSFLQEELGELILALQNTQKEGALVDAADALADIVYVALGTAHILDLPFDCIWKAVHRANMAKVPGPTKRNAVVDACKPAGWQAPEVKISACIGDHNATK